MRVDRILLTSDRLKALLRYEPDTGRFIWLRNRKSCMGKVKAGVEAGTPHGKGYVSIRIDGRAYLAHRLAWFYMHGQWPAGKLDHWDGVKANNRMTNLRPATDKINGQNIRGPHRDNSTGYLGVTHSSQGGFQAQIGVDGGNRFLGRFEDPAVAHQAYLDAKRELHEGCTI